MTTQEINYMTAELNRQLENKKFNLKCNSKSLNKSGTKTRELNSFEKTMLEMEISAISKTINLIK